MAYDYNKLKWIYTSMTAQQQQQAQNKYKDNADWQRFLTDYQKESSANVYTPATTQKVTNASNAASNAYGDLWGNWQKYTWTGVGASGNYKYNPNLSTQNFSSKSLIFGNNAASYESNNPWYLEKRNNAIANALYNEWKTDERSIRNYLSTFQDFRDYDIAGQNNTVQAILNRMWSMQSFAWNNNQNTFWTGNNTDLNSRLQSEIWNNYTNAQKWYSDLMWWSSNYAQDFDTAVKNKLQQAFWISDLNEFRNRYPEYADSLNQYLESVRWVWDSTDPSQRQMLDWQLQWIIWSAVGAWSDTSKLKVLESSIMDKFQDPDRIKQDAQNVIKLQTEWKNTAEIASEMWIPEDQVQQLILLANGLDSKAGEYYKLKSEVAKDITEPYDTKMQRLEEEKKIALDRANRNVERLKQDFDTNLERQKQQNDINLHNADFISWQYGYWFSRRGIEWLNYVSTQAQQIIDDLTKNYDRNNQEMADGIADIIRNWQRNNDDLMKASQDALTNAKNAFTSNMLAIQQQYGTVGLQAQQALSNNVQSFIEQAETIYDNALTRQQQNLSNLITNVSNLNALAAQNLTLRNAKIQQFQSESMNLNRNQLQSLAQQLGMDQASYQDLVTYQAQAVANELNGYLPWAWVQFQSEIQSLLDQWYTPTQAMQNIMNSTDFKAMQQAANGSGDNWSMSNWIMYNKATGEWQDLNGDEYWTIWDKLYNKRTWQIIDANWNATWNNYVTSQTVDGQTYGVSQETYNWLVNFYNKYADPTTWNIKQGAKWWQCGAFVNDYLQSLWLGRIFTDPITDKQAQINTPQWYTWQVWDVIVLDSPSQPQYWHVAIITWVNDDWTYTTLESNRKNNDGLVFSRTIDPNKTKVYGFYHPDGANNNWMSDYDMNTATMRIGRMAYWKNISEWEWKRVEDTLKAWMAAGKSTNEILYDILWMTITKNQNVANPFIDIMVQNSDADWLSAYNVQWFSDFINKWKFTQAMNLVEQAVAKERWGNFSKDLAWYENGAKYAYEKWNEIIDLINQESNKLWIVAGNVNKLKTKFVKDKDFQKIKSAIVNYVTDWRHEMLGAATTETELKMIDDLLPAVTDNPFNAITKIEEFQDYWLRKYNNTRGNLYLPTVDENSLLDKNKRLNLYMWISSTWRWNLGGWWSMTWWWGRG